MRVNERLSATDARARHIASTMRAALVASGGGARRDATRATRAKPNATRRARNQTRRDARAPRTRDGRRVKRENDGVSRRTIDGSTDDDDDDDDDRNRARESRTKDAKRTR